MQGYIPPLVSSGQVAFQPGLMLLGDCIAWEDKPARPVGDGQLRQLQPANGGWGGGGAGGGGGSSGTGGSGGEAAGTPPAQPQLLRRMSYGQRRQAAKKFNLDYERVRASILDWHFYP